MNAVRNTSIAAVFSFAAMVLPVSGQAYSVAQSWTKFQQICTDFITDPNGYMQRLQRPGRYGERVLSVSPDQRAISIYRRDNNIYEENLILLHPAKQIMECTVIAEYDLNDTKQIVSEVQAQWASTPNVVYVGGQVPQDYADDEGRSLFTEDALYTFAVEGVFQQLQGSSIVTTVNVVANELQMDVVITTPQT